MKLIVGWRSSRCTQAHAFGPSSPRSASIAAAVSPAVAATGADTTAATPRAKRPNAPTAKPPSPTRSKILLATLLSGAFSGT